MKATASAPANIAFIKYWGKKDEQLRLPTNSSISLNLSEAQTTTTVEFSQNYASDSFEFVGEKAKDKEIQRVIKHLDRLRQKVKTQEKAKVVTKNSFPKESGIAASASGFAALTVAAAAALGLQLSEKDLSILARLGSGSACRSIPDGFVLWEEGNASTTSFARSLFPPEHWDLRDILVIVVQSIKKVSSTAGMAKASTSPLFAQRLITLSLRLEKIKQALRDKNFILLGKTLEEECLNLYEVTRTQKPPLFYWNRATRKIIQKVIKWRSNGLPVYFTIDAGPNVHLICEAKSEAAVLKKIKELKNIESVIVNKPARGAQLSHEHLF